MRPTAYLAAISLLTLCAASSAPAQTPNPPDKDAQKGSPAAPAAPAPPDKQEDKQTDKQPTRATPADPKLDAKPDPKPDTKLAPTSPADQKSEPKPTPAPSTPPAPPARPVQPAPELKPVPPAPAPQAAPAQQPAGSQPAPATKPPATSDAKPQSPDSSVRTVAKQAEPQAEKKVQAVVAEPSSIFAGEPVTLRWYFTGKKVTVSGGRFGTGVVVTGRTLLVDHPAKTTRYTFNVDYVGEKTNEATGKVEMTPLHATYSVVAEVMPPVHAVLDTYRDPHGWQIACLKGWKHDVVSFPDPANNALVYFQQEDDSVERTAVSILPAEQMTAQDLMGKVQRSLANNYEQLQVVSDEETTFAGVPAVVSTFTGMDNAHPGTRTQSVLLAFVKNGRAYVVSGRTSASQYKTRQPVLFRMVRSFALEAQENKTASR